MAFWSLYRWGLENYFERSGDCDVDKQDKANQCKGEKGLQNKLLPVEALFDYTDEQATDGIGNGNCPD